MQCEWKRRLHDGFDKCQQTGSKCCLTCEDYPQRCDAIQCPKQHETLPKEMWDCLRVARAVKRGRELLNEEKEAIERRHHGSDHGTD